MQQDDLRREMIATHNFMTDRVFETSKYGQASGATLPGGCQAA